MKSLWYFGGIYDYHGWGKLGTVGILCFVDMYHASSMEISRYMNILSIWFHSIMVEPSQAILVPSQYCMHCI